jgi:hypothetical protein
MEERLNFTDEFNPNFYFLYIFKLKKEWVKLNFTDIVSILNRIYFETFLMLLDFYWCFILLRLLYFEE